MKALLAVLALVAGLGVAVAQTEDDRHTHGAQSGPSICSAETNIDVQIGRAQEAYPGVVIKRYAAERFDALMEVLEARLGPPPLAGNAEPVEIVTGYFTGDTLKVVFVGEGGCILGAFDFAKDRWEGILKAALGQNV